MTTNNPFASSQAYAAGLQHYSPGMGSANPYLSILGSALGTFAGGMAANPKMAQAGINRVKNWWNAPATGNATVPGTNTPASTPTEDYIDGGGLGAASTAGDNYFNGGTGGIGNGADVDAYIRSLNIHPSAF